MGDPHTMPATVEDLAPKCSGDDSHADAEADSHLVAPGGEKAADMSDGKAKSKTKLEM